MSRHRAFLAAALAGLVALVVVGIRLTRPPDLESADRITLYSIDGRDEPQVEGPGERLYGYQVLGKVVIENPAQRRELVEALKEGLATSGVVESKCYWPRHVLRAEHGDQVTDYVICFYCQNYRVNSYGGRHLGPTATISRHVRPAFDKPLQDANVPIAPD